MDNKKEGRNILEDITLILVGIFIFFSYIIKEESLQLLVTFGIALLTFFSYKKANIRLHNNDILWIVIIIISLISIIYSIEKDYTIRYDICLLLIISLKIILSNFKKFRKNIINVLIIFSSVHVIATIVYMIFPEMIQTICKAILTPSAYVYNISLMNYGANPGICSEHGFNAFCITVFLNIFYVKSIYNSRNKVFNFMMLGAGIIALLATGKRGLLIANMISMIILLIMVNIENKKKLKRLLFYIIGFFIILKVISYIPATQIVFERFKDLDETGNTLNGREVFYEQMLENIKENTILGSGAKTTEVLTGGNDGHNIYLQILSELGIIGMIVYLLIFIKSGKMAINSFRLNSNKENTLISIYYQIFFLVYGMSGNPLYNFSILLVYLIMVNLVTKDDDYEIKSEREVLKSENRNFNIS